VSFAIRAHTHCAMLPVARGRLTFARRVVAAQLAKTKATASANTASIVDFTNQNRQKRVAERELSATAILQNSAAVAASLLRDFSGSAESLERIPLRETTVGPRIALLSAPSSLLLCGLLGVWRSGLTATVLSPSHPPREWLHVLRDADCSCVAVDSVERLAAVQELLAQSRKEGSSGGSFDAVEVVLLEDLLRDGRTALGSAETMLLAGEADDLEESVGGVDNSAAVPDHAAMLVYTSGTTGPPKGAVVSHGNLDAQTRSLREAWAWTGEDRIANILPLHHVHGQMCVVGSALASGATLELFDGFNAEQVWQRWGADPDSLPPLSLFMAVPTIYHRLAQFAATELSDALRDRALAALRSPANGGPMRLMVSGSAALPAATRRRWREVTGGQQDLLERYGMTELGMVLSQPYPPPNANQATGTVGRPLPLVKADVAPLDDGGDDDDDNDAASPMSFHDDSRNKGSGGVTSGELRVSGPTVFQGYWRNEAATAAAFDSEGRFCTGDIVSVREDGVFSIMGRASVDILKVGGYKISALDIERDLLEHSAVVEVAVVGLDDEEFGQQIVAVVCLNEDVSDGELSAHCRMRGPPYRVPRRWVRVSALERNAMGKVNKKSLARELLGTK
jgi:malonyl-CoA/methylmalonyl-CoA synthetase